MAPRLTFGELTKFLTGFTHAFRGLRVLVATQRNAWFHAVATVSVITMGGLTRRTRFEWAMLIVAIGMVWVAEAVNTALERLADKITSNRDPLIRDAKDVAAAAVLLAAFTSVGLAIAAFWRLDWVLRP